MYVQFAYRSKDLLVKLLRPLDELLHGYLQYVDVLWLRLFKMFGRYPRTFPQLERDVTAWYAQMVIYAKVHANVITSSLTKK